MIWIIAGMLSVIISGVLAWPLIRGVRVVDDRSAYDLRVYKDQLRELDRDAARGVIGEAEATAARLEIQRRILAADDSRREAEPSGTAARSILGLFIIAAPVSAMVIYGMTGNPNVPDFPYADRKLPQTTNATAATGHPEGENQAAEVASIEAMVASLVARLEGQPNDVDGWILLARSFVTLERYEEAAEAYERALPLTNNAPDLMVDFAETVVMANGGEVVEVARGSFAKALQADAANPKARFYLGMHSAQAGNVQAALQQWIDLVTISPPGAPWIPAVQGQIEKAASELGVSPSDVSPSAEALEIASRTPREMPTPSPEDLKAASEMTAEDRNAMIQSMVQQLADRLESNPNDREGWLRLERAYTVLGQIEKAADAKARAAEATQ